MSATPGYHGQYLRVDVTSGSNEFVPLDDSTLRKFIGGVGLGAYLLLSERQWAADALAPSSPIIFTFSPLVGSPLTTSAKFAVISKSPLTNRFNDSLASSTFAIAGKRCGCDAIVIVGQACEPSVLVIDDGHVHLETARHLSGKTCSETEQELTTQLGNDFQLAVIGPAGERQVRFATISHDGRHAGRGGSGAVLGAKNLKAIAVRGTQRCEWAFSDQLQKFSKKLSTRSFGPATDKYRELGTATNLLTFNRLNALPTRNFQAGHFEAAEGISPEQLTESRKRTRAYCASCTIGCEHIYGLPGDNEDDGVRIEYENLFALGPMCGIGDPDKVLAASRKCDELGIDTISAGGTIAFAIECASRGLLDEPTLTFGNGALLLELLDKIATGEGLGNRLAMGSRQLAEQLGAQAVAIAPQVKGLELPGYEPRSLQLMALGLAVSTRGADHNRSGAYEADFSSRVDRLNARPEDVVLAVEMENRSALIDSLIICKFLRGVFDDLFVESADILRLTTGWKMTAEELQTVSRRVVAARKLFNQRAGWDPSEDTLPQRLLRESLPENPKAKISEEKLRSLVLAYNRARDWSDEGYLPAEQLVELGLESV